MKIRIDAFRDGSLVLICGESDMENDLVFASGAMSGDTVLDEQKAILEHIVEAVLFYDDETKNRIQKVIL